MMRDNENESIESIVAAMREALNRARRTLSRWKIDAPVSAWNEFDLAMDEIDSALSAPARNCDLFDNWYDAHQAWEHLPKDELGYFVAANGIHECEQAWLFAAAERKGEGDGR